MHEGPTSSLPAARSTSRYLGSDRGITALASLTS